MCSKNYGLNFSFFWLEIENNCWRSLMLTSINYFQSFSILYLIFLNFCLVIFLNLTWFEIKLGCFYDWLELFDTIVSNNYDSSWTFWSYNYLKQRRKRLDKSVSVNNNVIIFLLVEDMMLLLHMFIMLRQWILAV